jgi:ABC-type transport system involved in cytochrome c biogenesis permease subunit
MPLDRVTVFCFGASYGLALLLELVQLLRPHRLARVLSLTLGSAGLIAHTLYLIAHPLALSTQSGSMIFLAWILATFYLYGSFHHRRLAWGVFVLPLVLGLTVLGSTDPNRASPDATWLLSLNWLHGEHFWSVIHGGLLVLAGVGVCVAFLASVMYLVQAQRLKAKTLPSEGLRLLSLERLEQMNRRAIDWAFPLLTAGLLVGFAQMGYPASTHSWDWKDPKIVGTAVLWLVFAILLYLRYGVHLRGRRVAQLTIVAFILLVFTLASAHTSVSGGGP